MAISFTYCAIVYRASIPENESVRSDPLVHRLDDGGSHYQFPTILQRTHRYKHLNVSSRNRQGTVRFNLEKCGRKRCEVSPVANEGFNDRVLDGKPVPIGFSYRQPINRGLVS